MRHAFCLHRSPLVETYYPAFLYDITYNTILGHAGLFPITAKFSFH